MFIEALIISIVIGYLLRGKLKNLQYASLYKSYLIFIAFAIEATVLLLIKKNILVIGSITFYINLIMYGLLFLFVYSNRKNKWIVLISIGFVLNALPIFLNGGAMPVSQDAVNSIGLKYNNVSSEGLYTIIDNNTKLWFLGDILPKPFFRKAVVSVGDIISAAGLILFIVTGMTRNQISK